MTIPRGVDPARCWPEDSSHENGNYMCHCCVCEKMFIGHKRRVVCRVCSKSTIGNISSTEHQGDE